MIESLVSFFTHGIKSIQRCTQRCINIEIEGSNISFVSHAVLCREKRQKIDDIKRNIRDAILVRIPFGYLFMQYLFKLGAIPATRPKFFSFMRRVLFLFRCADVIINGLLSFGINSETRSRT